MSALNASKTPGIIVSEIAMMNSTFKGVHFLVEGDDDSKFWKPRIAATGTSIVNCEGKPNLVGASVLINRAGMANVAGVYDPDFERLFGILHTPNILVPTDENDLELTIIASAALNVLLHEYADDALVVAFEAAEGVDVSAYAERLSREFGKLRLLNGRLNHRVDFDRLSPYRFVGQDDWRLDLPALHAEYARLAGISATQLASDIAASTPAAGTWQLSQGHDTVRILAQGLRKRIGRKQISEQDLAKVLRIAYSLEALRSSQMYQGLKQIEAALALTILN